MLNKRYKFDGKPILNLTKTQLKNKKIVENKIKSGTYNFEKVKCVICGSSNFDLLAEKDRYGLRVSTVICKECGLVQTNPRMTQKSYNDFYDSNYRGLYSGHKSVSEEFFNNQIARGKSIINYIEKKTGEVLENKFVLEIGSGAGGILKPFKDKNNQVLGLDLGSEYIKFGQNKGITLKIGTLRELDKIKKKPDLVIYSHVLEHILNPYEELKILKRNLKRNSLVYIEVPGIKNLTKSYDQDFLRYLQNAHVYHFSLMTLGNLAKRTGYDLICGDENIRAIFKIGKVNNKFQNDYNKTIIFLKNLEDRRKNPLNLLKISLKRVIFNSVVFALRKTGTFEIAREIYHKYN